MPYCVNCGTEIPRGCKKCLICGNSPWVLAEDIGEGKKHKAGDKTEKLYLAPVLSIFVLFAAIFLLFGFSIWQLGVFGGASGGYSKSYYETETFGGPREIMLGMPYHVYRAFDFGDFAIFVNIMGLSMLVWSWYKIQKTVKSIRTLIISISGVIFIIFAFFIFIFGFNDLLTFTGGNVYYKPTFTQQYGWIIESIIFGFLGYFLLLWADRLERREDVKISLYPSIMIPVAYVLILVVLWVYIFGLHNTLHSGDYTNYRTNLAWIVETFVFGLSCILLFIRAGRILKAEKNRLDLTKPLMFTSSILLVATLAVYLYSIHSTFWDLQGEVDLIWIAELLGLGIPCVAFLMKTENIKGKDKGKKSIYPHILIPVSAILLLVTVFTYIAGVHFSLYSPSYSEVNFSWTLEVILYGIPAITFLIASDNIRKKEKQEKPILPLALIPISYLLLFITLLVFILGVHSTLWGYGDDDFKWIVETIVFLVPSLICLDYSVKSMNIRFTFIILASVIFLISTLPVYILGIHWLLSDYGNNSSDLMKILIETLVFAVPAAISLIYADKMRATVKVKSILPYTLTPISCILLLAFLTAYISGIHGFFADKYGENDFMWLVEALLFLTPGVYFLWKTESIRRKEKAKGPIFTYPLYGLVAILLAETLFTFIFGLNEFLYSTEQNLNWIIETLVYLISAAVPLYISEKSPSKK